MIFLCIDQCLISILIQFRVQCNLTKRNQVEIRIEESLRRIELILKNSKSILSIDEMNLNIGEFD